MVYKFFFIYFLIFRRWKELYCKLNNLFEWKTRRRQKLHGVPKSILECISNCFSFYIILSINTHSKVPVQNKCFDHINHVREWKPVNLKSLHKVAKKGLKEMPKEKKMLFHNP